jgi:hypothetical protein
VTNGPAAMPSCWKGAWYQMTRMSDATLLRVVEDVCASLTRHRYEQLLVDLGLYSLRQLQDKEWNEYAGLSRRELATRTLQESDQLLILGALNTAVSFRQPTRRALALDGIQFGQSIAGNLAEPAEERSRLESALTRQGLTQVQDFLNQSWDNFVQGNFEAANAMTRTALECFVQETAYRISSSRGNEPIPHNRRHIGPVDYRNYLQNTGFLDDSESRFLNSFYGYASTDGSHPGVSSESEARLRRFVAIGIALLFLEKMEDAGFMNSLT